MPRQKIMESTYNIKDIIHFLPIPFPNNLIKNIFNIIFTDHFLVQVPFISKTSTLNVKENLQ